MKIRFLLLLIVLIGCNEKKNIIETSILDNYIEEFNANDEELYAEYFKNIDSKQFLNDNIPMFECPDKEIEKIYYFRWWTFGKHNDKSEKNTIKAKDLCCL